MTCPSCSTIDTTGQDGAGRIEGWSHLSASAVLRQRMQELDPAFAVDGPDGDSLGHELEEKLEVDHIIQEAAMHENKEYIEKVHKLEEDVKKFHARDPEHDW